MAATSLPQDPAVILSDVESFFDALPAKRRRARIEPDQSPESENYGPEPKPSILIELDAYALTRLPVLLQQLGQTRSAYVADLVMAQIFALLGLKKDGGE